MESSVQALNEQYAIAGQISFHTGPGNLQMAVVNNRHALAVVTLAGAHVFTYTPHGGKPVLWTSPNAAYAVGRAMRGGVPVCWPWFGPHASEPKEKPMHGFVRTMLWSVSGTRALEDGSTELRMVVKDNEETRALWPHAFSIELTVTVGPKLLVEWTARNLGKEPYQYTGALHPYFHIGDIAEITIHGLEGKDYLDKTDGYKRKHQESAIRITERTDRVYLSTAQDMAIEDPVLQRTIHIRKIGSNTSVVWNPNTNDAVLEDVGEGQHKFFVCAEAANAFEDAVTVEPGSEGHLGMEIWSEPWRQR